MERALDNQTKRVLDEFSCSFCNSSLKKKELERCYEMKQDSAIGEMISIPKRRPVFVNYTTGKATMEKSLDDIDRSILSRVDALPLPLELPIVEFPMDDMWEAPRLIGHGITYVHQMILPRAAQALSALWHGAESVSDGRLRNMLLFFVEQAILGMSVLERYVPSHFSQVNQYLSGVYYVGSQIAEVAPKYNLQRRLTRLCKHAFGQPIAVYDAACISTTDCAHSRLPSTSVDYIFTDPPFGDNFPYSELNFSIEAWHGVYTDPAPEAVVERHKKNSSAQKGVLEYKQLMQRCFGEYYRVLKPGRWLTVVFSNSKTRVWMAIQEALGTAGFVVADVRTLDKVQFSFKQVTSTAVKQDLVISAYKPTRDLAERFALSTTTIGKVWGFINEHLGNVPVFVGKGGEAEVVAERTPQMLHDRMIAFFVQRRVAVPVSGAQFFAGLDERYPKRDGMHFLPSQILEYDRKCIGVAELRQLTLFVQDELSATLWVRQQLQGKPQTLQDLQPRFMQQLQLQTWAKHERTVEFKEILELNFLCYDGDGPVPNQIHAYLSTNFKELRKLGKDAAVLRTRARGRWYVPDPRKEGDLEKRRLRTLLKEFDEYCTGRKQRIRQFRTEAVRAGFKRCYDTQDYKTIVDVASRLPERVIQEDEKLLMYYDVAAMRLGSA